MAYDVKVVQCGNVMEVYKYSNPIQEGFKKIDRPRVPKEKTQREIEENQQRSIKRTKRKIFELVNTNYVPGKSSFLTLTFKDNITDYDVAFRYWDLFKKRVQYHFDFKLSYCGVVEFQERGAIHFHICLFNIPFIKQNALYDIWNMVVPGGGGVNIKELKEVDNVGAYLTSYLGKDMKNSFGKEEYKGKKRYFMSRRLKKGDVIKFDTNNKNEEELYNNLIKALKDNVVFEYKSKYEKTKDFIDVFEFSNGKKKLLKVTQTLFEQELEYKQIVINKNDSFRLNKNNNDIKIIL